MFNSDNLSINENNHLTIGTHDTVELAKEYGTPLYVLDEDLMRKNCRDYKEAIDKYYNGNGLILFASKALCTMYTVSFTHYIKPRFRWTRYSFMVTTKHKVK